MASKRPVGVGMLVASYDATGSHLMETCPSGQFYQYIAMAVGGRSQSARTYLESHFKSFDKAPEDELVRHAMRALKASTPAETEMTVENITIAIVGKDQPFAECPPDRVQRVLEELQSVTE
eukprot:Platyproteum_vivax@DN13784_c0_g1_i1.p1